MKARVTVTLKSGILDPQGKAIEGALRSLGVTGVASVRQGKVFDIELAGGDRKAGRGAAQAGRRQAARQYGDRELSGRGDRMKLRSGILISALGIGLAGLLANDAATLGVGWPGRTVAAALRMRSGARSNGRSCSMNGASGAPIAARRPIAAPRSISICAPRSGSAIARPGSPTMPISTGSAISSCSASSSSG